MISSEFNLVMKDGQNVHSYKWEPEPGIEIKGIIQLIHGSCEHSGRYTDFADFLTDNGYVVYASDLRGHGLTAENAEELGYFAEHDGWNKLVEDQFEVTEFIRKEQNSPKLFMIGHSMGSFLARHYAIVHGDTLDGIIAIGTAQNPLYLLRLGKFLATRDVKRNGPKNRSKLIYRLSYGSFNAQFEPARTECDWLTRDEKKVKEFLTDKLCGFPFTSSAFKDMFDGLTFITDKDNIKKTPKNLPVLLLSGRKDPVGTNGKTPLKAHNDYLNAGLENIKIKLYDNMRHEILNEIGKEEVYKDILEWLNNLH